MKSLLGFLFLLLTSQAGNIRFGFNRNVLMDEAGDSGNAGGGSEGGTGGDNSDNENEGGSEGGGTGGFKLEDLPAEAQKLIKDLRAESAKHRTSNKELKTRFDSLEANLKKVLGGDENDETPPEEKLGQVTAQAEALAIKNALLEIAVENGVPKDQFKYFSFLMNEKLAELEDDEELDEDGLNEILAQIKTGAGKPANSSFGGNGKPKEGGGQDGVTLEAFNKMTIMQKSALYQKDQATYTRLMAESKGQ